eukprot:CAMPEP_0198362464 /NCGR_PEP_ID=MMETSP1450-20131203/146139_1 /TAXON_ID=753684 ORGANISM="Madagascaria erythrocladiodes, Strain CCMP3234" /NCGR_SAMPLE_ID=MMETSP1450 /ASSEMBLY_ACC=CAM_ASM_001115 /LENGTH=162 /DNA_ID=CAMNT_0044069681 /DNA_START=76 /DNA_END=561 /DNA_ORIENTATION=+
MADNGDEAERRVVASLQSMFGALSVDVIKRNLRDNHGNVEQTIDALLNLASLQEQQAASGGHVDALCTAARSGDKAAVVALLRRGAAINEQDAAGRTALHYAVDAGRFSVVKELLVRGAAADLCDASGDNAVHLAVRRCGDTSHDTAGKMLVSVLLHHLCDT